MLYVYFCDPAAHPEALVTVPGCAPTYKALHTLIHDCCQGLRDLSPRSIAGAFIRTVGGALPAYGERPSLISARARVYCDGQTRPQVMLETELTTPVSGMFGRLVPEPGTNDGNYRARSRKGG